MIPRPYESFGGNTRELPIEYLATLAEQVAWQHLASEVMFAPIEHELARKCPLHPDQPHYHLVSWLVPQNAWAVSAMGDTRLHTIN